MDSLAEIKTEVRCPECAKKGYRPTLLGKISVDFRGVVWFYCKNCKQEMEVKRRNGEIEIEPKSR